MKKSLVYILPLLLLVGCARPLGLLSHEKMEDVLLDVHLGEAAIKVLDPSSKQIEKQMQA